LCGDQPSIKELIDYEMFCGIVPEPVNISQNPDETSVQAMKLALDQPALNIKVVDVRDPDEYEIAHVLGTQLIPLGSLGERFTELDPNQQIYLHCKSGIRSMKALKFLQERGFKYVKSVKGGIRAWSEEIDSSVATY
ncbi:MAG: molybdenum cofactor biosynthesis protein MoeB, partial [Verrucomicrobia bacterium]